MTLRNFKTIYTSIGYEEGRTEGVALLEETLSDGSLAYSIKSYDSYDDEFLVDCVDEVTAKALLEVLIKAQGL